MVPDSQNGLMKSLKRQLSDTRVYINSTALVLPQKKKRKTKHKTNRNRKILYAEYGKNTFTC